MKTAIVSGKCFRIGCIDLGTRAIRNRHGRVISFCNECFQSLIRSRIIDINTGELTVT